LRKEPNFRGDVKLKVEGKLIEDDCAIATIFNNFFIDSVKELGDTFPKREINISPNVSI